MKRSLTSFVFANVRMFMFLGVVALVAALGILPYYMTARAQIKTGSGLFTRTESHDPGLPNYDIRDALNTDKNEALMEYFASARGKINKDAAVVADIRDGFVRGEEALKTRLPHVKFEYNSDIRTPEVITPDVWKSRIEWLSSPSAAKESEILRNFVKENNELIGVNDEQADSLRVLVDAANPRGNMSFAYLEQVINGVPVFRGEVKAGFTTDGRIIRVINNLAPGLDYESLSTDFRDPLDAVKAAYRHINEDSNKFDLERNDADSTDLRVVFGRGDNATLAEKMYFPTEPGVAVPAWRIFVVLPVNGYYVIVDAENGTLLWRKNLTEDQATPATYSVYNSTTAYMNGADSPAPLSPYISIPPNDPTVGAQGPLGTRTNVSLIGNEAPNPGMNNLGWMTDGTNITDGNNVEGGIDRVAPDGVDAPQPGDGACPGAGCRVFSSTWNPPPGSPPPGDAPLTIPAQRGAVIQMFYIMNRYHDTMYSLGFTEPFFNFQTDNFGRGGTGNDRLRAEGQDSSGTNNANMLTPADGTRPRMQMFLWTGPTPDYDGTADGEVLLHEVTHGLSNRLHGNTAGLSTNMARGMGEGWSDWYAYTMLSESADPVNGIYTTGGYATFLIAAGFNANYYYGIRRFPRAPITFLGGATNKPHNPFTFRYVNSDCNTLIGTTTSNPPPNSAFPRGPIGSATCDQVHNIGEVWSSMLWEVRNRFVARLGHGPGTTRALQVVTDGMKLAPIGPTILQERDAIIAAAAALPVAPEAAADVLDVREGFRVRGAGFSASIQNAGTGANNTAVTEAFDAADLAGNPATVTTGDNNLLEPNECNTLNVPITNNSGNAATGITAVLSTTTPGITVTQPNSAYPDIPGGGGPVNNTTPYQVSTDNTVACFTQANFTLTVTYTGGAGGSPLVHNFSLPVGIPGNNYVFATGGGGTIPAGGTLVAGSQADDAAVAITLPAGWTSSVYNVAVTSLSASTNGMLTVNGAAATTFTNTALLAAVGAGNPTLFPAWDDYNLAATATTNGGIFINTVGVAPNREFYIEWRAAHFDQPDPSPVSNNFAVKLTEGSSVIQYIHVLTGVAPNIDGASATVGVQRASTAASPFTQAGFNTAGTITPGMVRTGTLPAGQCTPGNGPCAGNTADLSITKTDGVTTVNPGQMITYTIVASNAGPSAVMGATVTDTFPTPALTGVMWTCVGAGGGTCTAGPVAGNINDMVNLPVGASVTYTATATVNPLATFAFSNTARVTAPMGTNDPVPGNNSARDTDTVCPPATTTFTPVETLPRAVPDNVPAGTNLTYNVAGLSGNLTNVQVQGLTWSPVHTWSGDIKVTLAAPGGPTATIFERRGRTSCTTGAGSSDDLAGPYNFADAFLTNFHPDGVPNPVPAGNYFASQCATTPGEQVLLNTAFGGPAGPRNGTWTMNISDNAAGDTGSVSAVSLQLTTSGGCQPTAAGVTVSGRVLTPDGRGLRNAIVTITDSTGMTRTARSSSFGYYTFDGIEVGGTYVVSVGSKQFTFTPRTITVNDAVTDLDFIGNGSD
ncbi:MAG: M36 family metallopeptidase [Pyrinomonadaceae bacterium]